MDRAEERMVTTDQMIQWAEQEAMRAKAMADGKRSLGDTENADLWDRNATIAKATVDRLRLVRRMVETLRPE